MLISFTYTRNKKKNSSPRKIMHAEMLSSHSKILAEAISIAFASLQQRQSISLASFLQCPHLHQSRFPILICNKSTAEAYVQFFSHGSHSSQDFLFYYVIKRQLKHMFSFKSGHRTCSVKKVFSKISQISQENTCVGVCS